MIYKDFLIFVPSDLSEILTTVHMMPRKFHDDIPNGSRSSYWQIYIRVCALRAHIQIGRERKSDYWKQAHQLQYASPERV